MSQDSDALAGGEPTGHALLDAAAELHGALTASIALSATCGHHDPHAERTLMSVAHQHRPYVGSGVLKVARSGRLYPSWSADCASCNRRYPCDTVRLVCHSLGVALPAALE